MNQYLVVQIDREFDRLLAKWDNMSDEETAEKLLKVFDDTIQLELREDDLKRELSIDREHWCNIRDGKIPNNLPRTIDDIICSLNDIPETKELIELLSQYASSCAFEDPQYYLRQSEELAQNIRNCNHAYLNAIHTFLDIFREDFEREHFTDSHKVRFLECVARLLNAPLDQAYYFQSDGQLEAEMVLHIFRYSMDFCEYFERAEQEGLSLTAQEKSTVSQLVFTQKLCPFTNDLGSAYQSFRSMLALQRACLLIQQRWDVKYEDEIHRCIEHLALCPDEKTCNNKELWDDWKKKTLCKIVDEYCLFFFDDVSATADASDNENNGMPLKKRIEKINSEIPENQPVKDKKNYKDDGRVLCKDQLDHRLLILCEWMISRKQPVYKLLVEVLLDYFEQLHIHSLKCYQRFQVLKTQHDLQNGAKEYERIKTKIAEKIEDEFQIDMEKLKEDCEEAYEAVLFAEYLFYLFNKKGINDFTPPVMEWSKAVENMLNKHIKPGMEQYAAENKYFANRLGENRQFSVGTFPRCALYKNTEQLNWHYKYDLMTILGFKSEEDLLQFTLGLNNLKEIRNPGAHLFPVGPRDAGECRNLILKGPVMLIRTMLELN